ncbi:MAG: YdeI/OmpD-associated family protein [Terracidiphilus sp.]|jgi:uncharacterized protein YdeI (YjbR/CyaY-like superfamily)
MGGSKAKSFTAVLEPLQMGMGWVIARIPFDVAKTWPERRGLRVRGEIEGLAIKTTLMAGGPGGGHFLLVNRKMQAATKVKVGSMVKIRLEADLEDRPAVVPVELEKALKGDRRLRKWFDGLATSRRRDVGKWVLEPKSKESREKRAEQMAEWLLLAMEGETDTPPILKAAFQRQPLARVGWEAMTPVQRRNHLLGTFHYRGTEAREKRAAQAVEAALKVANRSSATLE